MKSNQLTTLSNEQLLQKKKSLKNIITGFIVISIVLILASITIFVLAEGKANIATILPAFIMPLFFLPLSAHYKQINTELKSRNLR